MFQRISLCAIAIVLAGCTTLGALNPTAPPPDPVKLLEQLKADTVVDLDAATALAQQAGDQLGALCYPVLKKYVGTGTPTIGKLKGVFSTFEAARIARMRLGVGRGGPQIPTDLKIGCAPLLMDEQDFALRLAGMVASGVR